MPFEDTKVRLKTSNLYHFFWESLDWIFPPHCGGCNDLGKRWCSNCQSKTELIKLPVCNKCGGPVIQKEFVHKRCISEFNSIEFIRAYGIYRSPLSNAIHKLKYHHDIGISESLAPYIIQLYKEINWETDYIIPVPLSREKLNERGFNQAKLIATPFSLAINRPLLSNVLVKIYDTKSQVGLSREERTINVQNAFIVREDIIAGKRIVLVDDVSTTGATLEACAKALKKAGAASIVGLTLAKAVHTKNGFSDQIQFKTSVQILN
jgi:ComF family protein